MGNRNCLRRQNSKDLRSSSPTVKGTTSSRKHAQEDQLSTKVAAAKNAEFPGEQTSEMEKSKLVFLDRKSPNQSLSHSSVNGYPKHPTMGATGGARPKHVAPARPSNPCQRATKQRHHAEARSGRRCNHHRECSHDALPSQTMEPRGGGKGRDRGDTLRDATDTTASKAQETKDNPSIGNKEVEIPVEELKVELEKTRLDSFEQQKREEALSTLKLKSPLRLRGSVENIISTEVGATRGPMLKHKPPFAHVIASSLLAALELCSFVSGVTSSPSQVLNVAKTLDPFELMSGAKHSDPFAFCSQLMSSTS